MWCNGSTNVFGAFSFGSSPDITTKISNECFYIIQNSKQQ